MTVGAFMNRLDAAFFANGVMREIEAARQLGAKTHQEIADHLNARSVPTRKGGIWHRAMVGRVLARSAWLNDEASRLNFKTTKSEPSAAEPGAFVSRVVRRKIID